MAEGKSSDAMRIATALSLLFAVGVMIGAASLPKETAIAITLAVLFHFVTLFSAVFAVPEHLPQRFGPLHFQVAPSETFWLERLRVKEFGRGLDRIGWNSLIREARAFSGRQQQLSHLAEQTWRSEIGHAWALSVTAFAASGLTFTWPTAAAWLLILSVAFHLYPIGLQRALRQRIQRLQRPY